MTEKRLSRAEMGQIRTLESIIKEEQKTTTKTIKGYFFQRRGNIPGLQPLLS